MSDNHNRPYFSVIVATRNAEPYIKECLDSLKTQDFENWECLITDDDSDDDAWAIIEHETIDDPRFKIRRSKVRVTALPNLIRMIKEAQGEVVFLLDGDDWLPHAHVLSKVHAIYTKFPLTDAAYGCYIRSGDGKLGHMRPVPKDKHFWEAWWYGHPLTWRRQLSIESFEQEPESYIDPQTNRPYRSAYDIPLYYAVLFRAREVYFMDEVLYVYRQHEDQDHSTPERLQQQTNCASSAANYWRLRDLERSQDKHGPPAYKPGT